jgi:HNH endonuclease
LRPVDRGPVPLDDAGNPLTFAHYRDAKFYLVERLGPYCSYCERFLATHIAVEHVEAKSTGGGIVDWENFLLACVNCNSAKGARSSAGKYLPHTHNTAYAFVYSEGARIEANPYLSLSEQQTAQETLALLGLNDLQPSSPRDADRRYDDYVEMWNKAEASKRRLSRVRLKQGYVQEYCEEIVEGAHSRGAFSIYRAVFADDPIMLKMLLDKFLPHGTRQCCFDADGMTLSDISL